MMLCVVYTLLPNVFLYLFLKRQVTQVTQVTFMKSLVEAERATQVTDRLQIKRQVTLL